MVSLARFFSFTAVVLIFIASQLFWIRRFGEGLARFISSERWRTTLGWAAALLYVAVFFYNLPNAGRGNEATHLTVRAALLQAPFGWWVLSSLLGFAVVFVFSLADRALRVVHWAYRAIRGDRDEWRAGPSLNLQSPGRRRFLEQSAVWFGAAPFVAGAYGLLYGRVNLETTQKRIALRHLPKAFQGFRIVQLSDLHIGPFMTAEEIRKYVDIANRLRPDLVALTGDFVTWDPTTQRDVVKALSGLRAPFGVFGCLGNHELWTGTQDSITRLFAAEGIRILRQARAPIESNGESLNLMGVDFQSRARMGSHSEGLVGTYLRGLEPLVIPDTVNILLSHNPNTFDRAAQMHIDLSLAGHTHGGQVTLEFIHPSLSPSRLITEYVKGWFRKGESQLYVNRGIGTIAVPIRVGAFPEITVFELLREP